MNQRWVKITFLGIFMIASCAYIAHHHPWISIEMVLENPDAYDGVMITHYQEPQIGEIYSDGFQLIQKLAPTIFVLADTAGLISGEFVGLRASFNKDGFLVAKGVGVAKRRRQKIWLSTLPVLIILFLFFFYFKWNFSKYQFELRRNA